MKTVYDQHKKSIPRDAFFMLINRINDLRTQRNYVRYVQHILVSDGR